MSINSYVLSKFPHHLQHPEGSSESLATKSQLLSIFYLNFVLTLLMALFEIGSYLFLPLPISRILTFICIIGSALSLILLKEGCHDLAGGVTLVYVHIVNSITTHCFHAPMAGIFGTICYINLSYYLTRSNKIIMINALASLVELSLHVLKVFKIFRNTLDEDQSIQIWSGSIALFVAFGYLSGLSFFQKANLSSLWYMVQEHCEKSTHLKKEVVNANKSQKALVSTISEEVKNTMKSLNFGIDHLFKILKDHNSTNVLHNLKVSGQLLLNLINNTMDAARIEANTLELNYEDTDFEEDVVKKALKIHTEGLKEKNIFVQTFIDKEMPEKLSVDSARMLQIMLNLLSNAIRSTPKNGKIFLRISWHEQCENPCTVQDLLKVQYSNEVNETSIEHNIEPESSVHRNSSSQEFSHEENAIRQRNLSALQRSTAASRSLRTQENSSSWALSKVSFRQSANQQGSRDSSFTSNTQGAGYLKIQLSDTSPGIPPEKLEDVFKRANGVELWISQQLAQKMSGDMIVESQLRRGTDFVLCVPTFYPREDSIVKRGIPQVIKSGMNALVVDDFESNRILHKLMLEKNGAKVQVANNGKEAIEMFTSKKEKHFDLILMDVFMPEVDGFAAAKKIREFEQQNKIKETDIYFVTGGYFAGSELSNIFEKIGGKDKGGLRMVSKPMEMHIVESILSEQKSKI